MRECVLEDGDILFRQGDRSEEIYIVNSGQISLRTPEEDGGVREEIKSEGALFGADELLAGLARAAQATAVGHTELSAFSPAEISQALATQQTYQQAGRNGGDTPGHDNSFALETGPDRLVLIAESNALIQQLGAAPIIIREFPFFIGRHEEGEENSLNLALSDEKPFHLSRRHFMFDLRRGYFSISDCGSHHGTLVDGELLGAEKSAFRAILESGDHEIIAGREVSPFRFICRIP